jgi:predicted dinucleotide-binding enzyme
MCSSNPPTTQLHSSEFEFTWKKVLEGLTSSFDVRAKTYNALLLPNPDAQKSTLISDYQARTSNSPSQVTLVSVQRSFNMPHKVAIIGAGNVGTILGGALLKNGKGFQIKYGVRDPSAAKYHKLLNEQTSATVASVHDAITWSEAFILAVSPSHDDADILKLAESLGPAANGKVVIDATNPVTEYPGLEVRWEQGTSAGEVLSAALPKSHVFKAFNTIGADLMSVADGSTIEGYQGHRLTMLIAGPSEGRHLAEAIVDGVGFEPSYVGPIRFARNLEAIAELWIHLGVPGLKGGAQHWGRNFHFQVVGKH